MSDDIKIKVGVASSVRSGMSSVSSEIKSAFGGINSALGTIGLGLGFGAIVGGVKSLISSLGALQDQADQVNFSTTNWQKLVVVAGEGGIKVDQLGASLSKLTKAQGDVGKDKTATAAFDALGLSIEKVIDLNPDELLVAVAQGFEKTGNMSALFDLFGKSASKLIPTLHQLAGGFDKLNPDGIISESDIKKLDQLDEKLQGIGRILKKWAVDIGSAVVKAVELAGAMAGAESTKPKSEIAKDIARGTLSAMSGGIIPLPAPSKEALMAAQKAVGQTPAEQEKEALAVLNKETFEKISKAKQVAEIANKAAQEARAEAEELGNIKKDQADFMADLDAKDAARARKDAIDQAQLERDLAIRGKELGFEIDKKHINDAANAQKLKDDERKMRLEKIMKDNAFGVDLVNDNITPEARSAARRRDRASKREFDRGVRQAEQAQDRVNRGVGTPRDLDLVLGLEANKKAKAARDEMVKMDKDAKQAAIDSAKALAVIAKKMTEIAAP